MAVKLTDKEISALAKKMADKRKQEQNAKNAAVAKTKLPQAKKIVSILNDLPDAVMEFLYSQRYQKGAVTADRIAKILAEYKSENIDSRPLESDVVLAAHDCTSMSALCKKLGI